MHATDMEEAQALSYERDIVDVYSNSWGPFDDGYTVEGPRPMARRVLEEGTRKVRTSLSLSLSLSLTHTHTHAHSLTLSLSLTHSHTHAHTHTHTLSLSLTLTHIHTHTLSLSLTHTLSHTHTHTHTLSLSLSHTLTHTHTHTLSLSLPHPPPPPPLSQTVATCHNINSVFLYREGMGRVRYTYGPMEMVEKMKTTVLPTALHPAFTPSQLGPLEWMEIQVISMRTALQN